MQVERDFGLRLPLTYKMFVSTFGSGVFGHDLYVLNPVASEENVRLSKSWLLKRISRIRSHLEPLPRGYFDGRDGIFPVATTTSQIDLGFNVRNAVVGDQVTIVDLGGRELEETGLSLCQFLVAVYSCKMNWMDELQRVIWGHRKDTPFFRPI